MLGHHNKKYCEITTHQLEIWTHTKSLIKQNLQYELKISAIWRIIFRSGRFSLSLAFAIIRDKGHLDKILFKYTSIVHSLRLFRLITDRRAYRSFKKWANSGETAQSTYAKVAEHVHY